MYYCLKVKRHVRTRFWVACCGIALSLYFLFLVFQSFSSTSKSTRSAGPSLTTAILAQKSVALSKAWHHPECAHFGEPFLLRKRHDLEVPYFKYWNFIEGQELHCAEDKCGGCGTLQETLNVCALEHCRNHSQGEWTVILVTPRLHSVFKPEEKEAFFQKIEALPRLERHTYGLNLDFLERPTMVSHIETLRNDLVYLGQSRPIKKPSDATLPHSLYVSMPYHSLLQDRYLSDESTKKRYTVSFRGKCDQKERFGLAQLFANYSANDVLIQWKECDLKGVAAIEDSPSYWQLLQESKFCFSPGEDDHFLMRQLDAVSAGCIPIFVSERPLELPFGRSLIPWHKISLFLPLETLGKFKEPALLVDYLRRFSESEVAEIQKRIHEVYLEYLVGDEERSMATLHDFWYQYNHH